MLLLVWQSNIKKIFLKLDMYIDAQVLLLFPNVDAIGYDRQDNNRYNDCYIRRYSNGYKNDHSRHCKGIDEVYDVPASVGAFF